MINFTNGIVPSARRGTCERACEFSAVPAAMASRVVPLSLSSSRQRRRGASFGQIAVCTWRRCSVAAARRDAIPLAQGFRRVRPGTSMASVVIDAALHLVQARLKTRSPTACSQRHGGVRGLQVSGFRLRVVVGFRFPDD